MAQKHNIDYEEKPMTRDGRIQGPSRRYRRLRHPSFPAAEWAEKNPLLQRGEIGFEIDTHQAKIGDGVTYWNDLPYGLVAEYAWGSIVGDINDQTDLVNFVDDAVSAETDRAMQAESVLQDNIDAEALTRSNADTVLQGNINAEQTARENADSALSDRITTNADNLAQEISNRSDADDSLRGQITANKDTMDDHIANLNNPHQVTKAQVGLGNVDNTSDLNKPISTATQAALDGKQPVSSANYQLGASGGTWVTMSAAQQNALNSGATSANIGQISTNTENISTLNSGLANEITDRQTVDNSLQTQIDALVAKSDVVDIVGTYAELQAYDTTNLGNNDVIKVLSDSTHSNAPSYYRWVITGGVGAWVYIGSESETYTKAETDALLNDKQDTLSAAQLSAVNSGVTSSTVTQVGTNTSDISTINNTISGYGNIVTHNVSEFATAAQGAKADSALQSGDNVSELVNDAGYLTASDLSEKTDYYGTCTTAAATQAKVVDCAGFVLKTGVSVRVKFTNAQTYNGAPTLNVNATGAVSIKSVGTTNAVRYCWLAGEVVAFTYDGTNWIMEDSGIATTSYYGVTALTTSATSTSAVRAATPASINNLAQNMLAGVGVYSTSATYAVGDRVRYGYFIYECNTAITTAEAWNAAHWTALESFQTQLDKKVIGDGTITITQGGTTKGTFTTNQSGDTTINLDAGGGSIDAIDNITITKNTSDEIQAVATVNANIANGATNPIYDWVGTLAEYTAQDIENQHPDWLCFVTDDISGGDSVYTKTQADDRFYTKTQVNDLLVNKVSVGHEVIAFQAPTAANNYTWYRKYKSGWVEQGGLTLDNISEYTLPIAMANTKYYVNGMWNGGKSATFWAGDWRCYPLTTSVIFCNPPNDPNVHSYAWEVKGMAAY